MLRLFLATWIALQIPSAHAAKSINFGFGNDIDSPARDCAPLAQEGTKSFETLVKYFGDLDLSQDSEPKIAQKPTPPNPTTPPAVSRPPQVQPTEPVVNEPPPKQTPRVDPAAGNYANYTKHPLVQSLIKKMQQKQVGVTYKCYRYVKYGLCDRWDRSCSSNALISAYPGIESAKNAGPNLKANCFENIMRKGKSPMTPAAAPIGAILVYSGGEHGHIEVKTSKSQYCSDYCGNARTGQNSISGRGRTLIGVWVKPALDPNNPSVNPKNCR